VTWGRRWDSYLYPGSDKTIHWFSIINAVVIFFLVSLTAAFIAIRVLGISIPYINEDAVSDWLVSTMNPYIYGY
jgi:hypothetical protein